MRRSSRRRPRCFNPSPGLNVFQTRAGCWKRLGLRSFNPSPGLNVFQTKKIAIRTTCLQFRFNPSPGLNVFQTVEVGLHVFRFGVFQSLTWVERLSDPLIVVVASYAIRFQSLTWVERLSDRQQYRLWAACAERFNPSPGLNVFQTPCHLAPSAATKEFQSLTWVERLSDYGGFDHIRAVGTVSIPHLG